MAKSAKSVDTTLTETQAKQARTQIMDHYANIEASKGRHMNTARRERDGMTGIYERLAQFGFSQKASKLTIKIARTLEKVKGWQADLEEEDRKQAQRLAKLQGDQMQLTLFGEEKPAKTRGRKRRAPEPETPVEEVEAVEEMAA